MNHHRPQSSRIGMSREVSSGTSRASEVWQMSHPKTGEKLPTEQRFIYDITLVCHDEARHGIKTIGLEICPTQVISAVVDGVVLENYRGVRPLVVSVPLHRRRCVLALRYKERSGVAEAEIVRFGYSGAYDLRTVKHDPLVTTVIFEIPRSWRGKAPAGRRQNRSRDERAEAHLADQTTRERVNAKQRQRRSSGLCSYQKAAEIRKARQTREASDLNLLNEFDEFPSRRELWQDEQDWYIEHYGSYQAFLEWEQAEDCRHLGFDPDHEEYMMLFGNGDAELSKLEELHGEEAYAPLHLDRNTNFKRGEFDFLDSHHVFRGDLHLEDL